VEPAICSGETVVAHWVDELVAKALASGSLDATAKSSVAASGMGDTVHALEDEPCSNF
jgi:hypothetical protein